MRPGAAPTTRARATVLVAARTQRVTARRGSRLGRGSSPMDLETIQLLKRGLPLFSVLAACLLVLTLGAILYRGRDTFVLVAVLLSLVLALGVRALQRLSIRGAPRF